MGRRYAADPLRALDIEELRRVAARSVPHLAFEYVEGGADDEATLRRNREAFARWTFVPRTLRDVSARDASSTLFGTTLRLPLVIAPTGFNGLLRHGADGMLARAAQAAGIPFTASTVATASLEQIAQDASGRLWFQLYPMKDAAVVDRMVERAEAAGYEAMVITSDVPVYGNRTWDHRNFVEPGAPTLRSRLDVLRHPRWLLDVMLRHGAPQLANFVGILPPGKTGAVDGARYMSGQINAAFDWQQVRRLRARWRRPLLVKGILALDDARRAVEEGLEGIVVSNHGGRQLDRAVSALDVLPEIASAVGQRLAVLVDGGFRRGGEVVMALILGARAVMIGRPTLYGVAAAGEAGARHALAILEAEIDRVLGLLGCRSLAELDPSLLRRAD